jgi:methionyl aminopeptidase
MTTKVKNEAEIRAMRTSGKMLATVLNVLKHEVQSGMTTKDLAERAAVELKALGGHPSFLGYQGFPDVICISLNQEVVHGIPSRKRIIAEGDLIGLDFGVTYEGMITDSAISMIVGKPRQKGHVDLVRNTEAALTVGIGAVHDQVRTGDIGHAIEKFLKHHNYGIVRDLVGHGVGHQLHEDPNIPNYGRANTGPWLSKGMTIAIEPMVTLGTDRVSVGADDWTIVTADGSWAAHFEHTVLITDEGAEILTSY